MKPVSFYQTFCKVFSGYLFIPSLCGLLPGSFCLSRSFRELAFRSKRVQRYELNNHFQIFLNLFSEKERFFLFAVNVPGTSGCGRVVVRGSWLRQWKTVKQKSPALISGRGFVCKVGGDLLSHILLCSTIGAGGLNFSVRNGKRWNPSAIATLRL